jgi:hypothetical protein
VLRLTTEEILTSFPSSAAGPPRTCCVVITGGSLALIDIFSKVDEEQDISSQSVPPASCIYDAMMHGNEWSLYHRSNGLVRIKYD